MRIQWLVLMIGLSGCSTATFVATSDPLAADVYYVVPKTGEKKSLGKTPLKIPAEDVKKAIQKDVSGGEYFAVRFEKQGYVPQTYMVPAGRFGTLVTSLEVKLKKGEGDKEAALAKSVLDRLFLAQKLALTNQYERAQVEIDRILADFPGFARAYSMRASIFLAQKNYTESLKWYEEAIKADPQMEEAVKMIAKIKDLQSGKRTPAEEKPEEKKDKKP